MGLGDKERLVVAHHDGGAVEWRIQRPLLSLHDLPPLLALGGMVAWVSGAHVSIPTSRALQTVLRAACSSGRGGACLHLVVAPHVPCCSARLPTRCRRSS